MLEDPSHLPFETLTHVRRGAPREGSAHSRRLTAEQRHGDAHGGVTMGKEGLVNRILAMRVAI